MDDERASRLPPKLGTLVEETGVVGEHSSQRRRFTVRYAGAVGKENVGISNDNVLRKIHTENPRFPQQR